MIVQGQVFKFVGIMGLIRPDEMGQNRVDVLFKKREYNLKIGDRVEFEPVLKNGRKHAENLKKVEKIGWLLLDSLLY